jgi:multidrug resistance efflux pump
MKNFLKKLQNPIIFQVLMSVFLIALVSGGLFYYLKIMQNRVLIENSVVTVPTIPITSITTGKLRSVSVVEGQKIKKGDVVAVVGSELLRAYDDGVIVETSKLIGATIAPGTPIAKIVNVNEMRIDGTIDENKGLNKITLGQVVSFTVDALPGKIFWGYVDEVAPSAKQTSMTFSISSERPVQQFEVYARFDANAQPEIKNGMSAKMTVFTAPY